jgi:hypothetical protein
VNTTLGTLVVGGATGDIVLSAGGTGSTGNFGAISGSGLDITGDANIAGNLTLGGQLTIGDATSDTINVVASLSSSLIPQTTNAFDLGSATKIWRDLYISTGSIKFVDGTTVVKEFNLESIEGLEAATGSSNISITNLNSATASLTQRVDAIESVSGTFARTNSNNSFSGLQSFNNINVEGTASFAFIQSTTGSSTAIGEEFIVLNASTPSSNFAGIKVVDSGSSFATASFVYDGLNNNWIFEKANVGSSDTSVAIFGPISTGGLGTEIGLTGNYIVKGGNEGHGHHITSSQIYAVDDLVSIGSNLVVTGSVTTTTLNIHSDDIPELAFRNAAGDSLHGNIFGGPSYLGPNRLEMQAGNGLAFRTKQFLVSDGDYNNKLIISGSTFDIKVNTIVTGSVTVSGSITATGDVVAYSTSDRRHKNNIVSISDALSKVTKLNGVTWEWNDDVDDVTKQTPKTGLIAQEVQEVLPEVVKEREGGFLALDYSKMMGLMVEAIKEQQTQIHTLTLEIEELKKQKGL